MIRMNKITHYYVLIEEFYIEYSKFNITKIIKNNSLRQVAF